MGTTAPAGERNRVAGASSQARFGTFRRIARDCEGEDAWPGLEPWLGLATQSGLPITLCEAAVGRALPHRAGRTAWLKSLPKTAREGVTVFTDAAHLAMVWSWEAPGPAGFPVRVEHRLPHRADALRLGLAQLPARASRPDHPVAPADADRLLAALIRRCPRLPSRGMVSLPGFLDYIEEDATPAELRRVWRALMGLRILDPAAADAEWLLSIAVVLEWVGIALLERMRSWVDDSAAEGGHRAEFLRDFRETVEAAEGPRAGYDRAAWLRRLIVQQNVHGLASKREDGKDVANRLLAYAGLPPDSTCLLHANVSFMPAAPKGDHSGGDDLDRTLREDIEILRRGWAVARAAAIAGFATDPELERAEAQIGSRRDDLSRRIATAPLAPRPREQAEWLLAFATVARQEDFDLIRG